MISTTARTAPENAIWIKAEATLLKPAALEAIQFSRAFDEIFTHGVDYADLYFQSIRSEAWSLEEGIVKSGSFNIEQGVGVRAISHDKTAFAYSNDISTDVLLNAARTVRAIARTGQQQRIAVQNRPTHARALYEPIDPLASLRADDKVHLLHRLENYARAQDPRVTTVIAHLAGEHETILIAGSDGRLAADIRPLVRLSLTVVVEENGRRETGSSGGGARTDYAFFNDDQLRDYAYRAVHQAVTNLHAQPAPAGIMPVVLGPGWPGILLHEAIGHGLEGDFNRKGSSAFTGRIGERVAAPGVTVVDDGSLPDRRGSLSIDDEGTATRQTVLIENGILRSYMQDDLNARLMGTTSTGNGRRESYAYLPMPRMTNTYMLPGGEQPENIIASVRKGIYAVNFGGGQVDITNGKFVFSISEAYIIENGKLKEPVKGATLIGNGPDALTRVKMIGNDLSLDSGVGTCGKDGQSVPVGVGQPTLLIEGLTVGGTA